MANINGTNRNDIINATAGNDAINGGAGDDTINAGEGNNAVDGGSGNDSITAGAGNDVIDGGSGNDVINAGNGNNTVDGGSGNDNITTGSGNDSIDGESGNDTIFAGAGKDVILAGEGNDTVYGQDGDDVIYGEAGDDLLDGGDGNDYINGGDGRDIVYGGKGSDRLVGADQNDTLYGGSGDDVIGVDDAWRCNFSRENGQDVIYGDGKNSASGAWLSGADEVGSDLIYSGRGNDHIYGDSGLGGTVGGNDRIYAGGGNDAVFGEGGNDVIYGEDGDDLIDGGAGDDTLKGGDGRDTVYGGAGGDIISGADGRDLLYGGSGDDRIGNNDDNSWRHGYFSESGGDIIYGDGKDSASGLAGATGNDFIFSGQGNDTLYGDNGNNFAGAGAGGADTIYAGSGNDTAYGEGGDDELFGEKGNDSLYGGSGADEIAGGLGADTLSGGSGADTFIFTAELNQHSHRGWHGWGGWHGGYDHYDLQSWSDSTTMGMDTITDFLSIKDLGSNPLITAGGPDKIDLVQLLGDDVDLKWGGTTPTAYGVWFKHEGGNTYVYADISGNPAVAELAFKLTGIHHLVVGDFLGVSQVNITLGDVTVNEGSGTASIVASVDQVVTGSNLQIILSNGATVTILVGQTTGTSSAFAVQGDDIFVDGEAYSVSIASATGGNLGTPDISDTATITVNDTIDITTVTLDDVTVNEDQPLTYTASVNNPTQGAFSVTLSNGVVIHFADGASVGSSAPQPAQGDDANLDSDSFVVSIASSAGGNYEGLDTSTASATAQIADTIDEVTVNLSTSDVDEDDAS
ncbi:immunoglobulin-like domain-containing protein, partial [Aeromonas sp. A-5]|uniref:immunoglobulin-like domain-containing protein n=1 Tax=Aeromonas ichthyocola TaxID=3367746 RepID=UPI0038EB4DBE